VIGLVLDNDRLETGEFLTGEVHWSAEDDRTVRRIVVAAEWETSGAGNIASGVARSKIFRIPDGSLEAKFTLRLLIPYEGPVSFDGELITMRWMLRAKVDQSGFDEHAESGFTVVPRKAE
jgi:hypothetical protein